MLRRLQASSLNLLVLGTSAAIFIAAFLLLQAFTNARIPKSVRILIASRDIQVGERLGPGDFEEKTVFVDELTGQYIDAADAGTITGAYAALPIPAGRPIPRTDLISPDLPGERFSALLAQFPDHSLFPLPLDSTNITAPPVEWVRPGDLVGVTVVIRTRPPQQATPTPDSFSWTLPGPAPTSLPPLLVPSPESDEADATRSFPPLAKDLFPGGVRVLGIRGLPQPENTEDGAPAFSGLRQQPMLILLLPEKARETLALALQQGDRLFVSLISHGTSGSPTGGFTYWDFEAWFREDRSASQGQ